jgi:Protein of unknown function (DUF2905)
MASCAPVNRTLVILGLLCIAVGLGWTWARRIPLFRLPGDFVIERPGMRVFIPLTTMLLISVFCSLVALLLRK